MNEQEAAWCFPWLVGEAKSDHQGLAASSMAGGAAYKNRCSRAQPAW